jgi:hypothetical protein
VIKLLKTLDFDSECDDKHWALLDVLEGVSTRDKEDFKVATELSNTAKIIKVDINDL